MRHRSQPSSASGRMPDRPRALQQTAPIASKESLARGVRHHDVAPSPYKRENHVGVSVTGVVDGERSDRDGLPDAGVRRLPRRGAARARYERLRSASAGARRRSCASAGRGAGAARSPGGSPARADGGRRSRSARHRASGGSAAAPRSAAGEKRGTARDGQPAPSDASAAPRWPQRRPLCPRACRPRLTLSPYRRPHWLYYR